MPDVVVLGEALVDLIPVPPHQGSFEARPGGAPANVAGALAHRGHVVAFVSRLGADELGALVLAALGNVGVVLDHISHDPGHPTTLAVVMRGAGGRDTFLLYLHGTASASLSPTQLPDQLLASARVLHVGTLTLAAPTARGATIEAVRRARQAGVAVSLDVNLRPNAWPNRSAMVSAARALIAKADIVKMTASEMDELGLSHANVLDQGPVAALVTDGGGMAVAITRAGSVSQLPPRVEVVDPTGAGDAFVAAMLDVLLCETPHRLDLAGVRLEIWRQALVAATLAGAEAVGQVGAMLAAPDAMFDRSAHQPSTQIVAGPQLKLRP